jgi:hypothetical protein
MEDRSDGKFVARPEPEACDYERQQQAGYDWKEREPAAWFLQRA